ncbi:MAG: response regulator transcription factor [Gemmatimonadota bacterium]|nr:response regulator transcription factor [Gemmatimonadota bacterium]
MIHSEPGFEVLAASADVDEALRKVREATPDVVLIDFGLADHDSLRLTATVHQEVPAARVIVMGLLPLQENVATFVRAGASGFIMKNASFEDFFTTIRKVAAGAEVLPSALTHSLFSQIVRNTAGADRAQLLESVRLTTRELQVIALLGDGLSNKEIGVRLHIAVYTVKSHVHNVLEKLALHSRLEVAAFSHNSAAGGTTRRGDPPRRGMTVRQPGKVEARRDGADDVVGRAASESHSSFLRSAPNRLGATKRVLDQ